MIPSGEDSASGLTRFPRMCGGDPTNPVFYLDGYAFSPHARGVIHGWRLMPIGSASFPRMRGESLASSCFSLWDSPLHGLVLLLTAPGPLFSPSGFPGGNAAISPSLPCFITASNRAHVLFIIHPLTSSFSLFLGLSVPHIFLFSARQKGPHLCDPLRKSPDSHRAPMAFLRMLVFASPNVPHS